MFLCYTSDKAFQKGWALDILKLRTPSLFQQRNNWVLAHEDVSILFCVLLSVHQMGSNNSDILGRLFIVDKYVQIL